MRLPTNVKPLMRDVLHVTEEMNRRAGQVPMEGPAKRLSLLAQRLPPALASSRGELEARARELAAATKATGKAAFNALVDSCVGCHKVNARNQIARVEALRLK